MVSTDKNWQNTAALILGILTILFGLLTAIPAVILGLLGVANADKGLASNRQWGQWGIIAAIAFTVLNIIVGIIIANN